LDGFSNKKTKILVITGATASGKSSAALDIAEQIDGEIVSADSMQIYRHLDIGTAKPSKEEQQRAKHHLIDIVEPHTAYSVFDYVKDAERAVNDIISRGKAPIICGGTGLYIDSLIFGIKMNDTPTDIELRRKIEREYDDDREKLFEQLKAIDPEQAAKLHINDRKRVVRAFEKYRSTGKTASELNALSQREPSKYEPLVVNLCNRDRSILYRRIEERIDNMLQNGIIDEAQYVYDNREIFKTAAQAIGYKEFFGMFDGTSKLDECIAKLKQSTRNYAKRQICWFGRYDDKNDIFAEDAGAEGYVKTITDLWFCFKSR